MQYRSILWLLLELTGCSATQAVATDQVPLLGPSFIANFDSSRSQAINEAKSKFPGIIEGLFSSGDLNRTDLIFAIDVFSASTNDSIYSYYHVGEGQEYALGAGRLDDHTVSRIGSVSKLFTAYAIIAQAGIEVFYHPVTRYLPELAGNSTSNPLQRIDWNDITVGALLSQQAGSGGTGGFFKYIDSDVARQTTEEFLRYMRDEQHPVISPFRTAAYSDAGYTILGEVLARLSGSNYLHALHNVLGPLGLNDTSTTAPTGPGANVIDRSSQENSTWGYDIPLYAGTGGIYTSLADLRTTGLSILNSEILPPTTTREWMKPHSGTGSLVELVGAPWEITRLMIPVSPASNRTRVCDLYLKAGGNGDYTSVIALSPDHGLGYSILVAGSNATASRWPIRDALGETFVPAAEHAAAENARDSLSGTFVSNSSQGTNMTLTADSDQPGLGLESFFVNGEDALALEYTAARLYPTGLYADGASLAAQYKAEGRILASHRVILSELPLPPRAAVEGGQGGDLFDHSFAWGGVGFYDSLDEFILELVDGRVTSIRAPYYDLIFNRVEL